MDIRDWFKGQYPTNANMDELLHLTEKEIGLVSKDYNGTRGLVSAEIVPYATGTPDWEVHIPVGAAVCDRESGIDRQVFCRWTSVQDIDCTNDKDSNPTTPSAGNERYIAIFVKYDNTLSGAWTDFDSGTGYYNHDASFTFEVWSGTQAAAGSAVKVSNPSNWYVRICDVLLDENVGTTGIDDPADPDNPGVNEIDYTITNYLGAFELREARYGKRKLTDAVENVFAGKLQMAVKRQAIINGNFDWWQHGAGWSPLTDATATYTADRWEAFENLVTGDLDILQATTGGPTEAESGVGTRRHFHALVSAADSGVGAGEYSYLMQKLEGMVYKQLAKGWATLTFWIRAKVAGTYCVAFQNGTGPPANASWVAEYTVAAPNTWEKKTIEVNLDESVGTWTENGTGLGFRVVFVLSCGSTRQTTTTGAWVAGDKLATSNQTNLFDNLSDEIRIAQVQLNAGRSGFPLLVRHPEAELALCQRYHEKSYEPDTAPTTSTEVGMHRANCVGFSVGNGLPWGIGMHPRFRVLKRATPTVSLWVQTGGANSWYIGGANRVSVAGNIGVTGFDVRNNTGGPVSPADGYGYGHYAADAEL